MSEPEDDGRQEDDRRVRGLREEEQRDGRRAEKDLFCDRALQYISLASCAHGIRSFTHGHYVPIRDPAFQRPQAAEANPIAPLSLRDSLFKERPDKQDGRQADAFDRLEKSDGEISHQVEGSEGISVAHRG